MGVAVPRFIPREALLLGKNIAVIRKASGLSQDILAEKLDVSTRYVQKLESGIHSPSIGLLVRLRKVLKTDWTKLLEGL